MFPFYTPLKIRKTLVFWKFSDVLRGYKIEKLARNGLSFKSFSFFQDALHLETRPPLHNSSLLLLFTPLLLLPYVIRETWCFWIYEASLVSLIAIITHHLRDANRRGLWLWPHGDTPPLKPAMIYMSFIIGSVVMVKFVRIQMRNFQSKELNIEESV